MNDTEDLIPSAPAMFMVDAICTEQLTRFQHEHMINDHRWMNERYFIRLHGGHAVDSHGASISTS